MRAKRGFTLVEILIVVVILGILAAIVIPQFTDASTQAKTSSVKTDLQTLRSVIQLYKAQHNDDLPSTSSGGANFVESLTESTDVYGATSGTTYGPYLISIPVNGFSGSSTVTIGQAASPVVDSNTGWYFNDSTGEIWAADDAAHTGW